MSFWRAEAGASFRDLKRMVEEHTVDIPVATHRTQDCQSNVAYIEKGSPADSMMRALVKSMAHYWYHETTES